ncbi:MAG: family 16 glycosylhydrolase [Ignavibacteriaceae bacterium]|nr:family 16 glycosylhydrolase [Ignavibacteriaceae bacterium]
MKKFTFLLLLIFASNLIISAKDFKGGEYRTKESFLYGRFETRLKSPQKEGVLASFFTYHDFSSGIQNWNEIDIEILGRYDNAVQFNVISPGQVNNVRQHFVNFYPHLDYHVYAFEWTPDYVSWFIDGIEVYRQTEAHIATINKAQKLMMNIWNPAYNNWVGEWNANILPAFAYYDWVSYAAYTPGHGSYGTNNNFTPQWRDEFDNWDTSRWDKATHTFGGNNCDFIHENIVFRDGKMILCLTDNVNLGYVDKKAPSPLWARATNNKVRVMFSEEMEITSAETPSNYIIVNSTINSVTMLEDGRSVELDLTGLDPSLTANLVLMNLKDLANPPNNMGLKAITIQNTNFPTFPFKFNAGGIGLNGYVADQEFRPSTEYGYLDGSNVSYASSLQISGTDEDVIYQTDRTGLVKYLVRVPNGTYDIKLMLAENFHNSTGKRIFDVYVQGDMAEHKLDIFQKVGANTAYEKMVQNVVVSNNLLEIFFAAHVHLPLINGFVITQKSLDNKDESSISPEIFQLNQNYPNPFNGQTTISYTLSKNSDVKIKIYNTLGDIVFENGIDNQNPGNYIYNWDGVSSAGIDLASGIYFLSLIGSGFSQTKKMVFLK